MKRDIVVTRHPALVERLREIGIIDAETPVIEHADVADVIGRRVIGVLPMRLAAYARRVVEVPLNLTREDRETMSRGEDLSIERLREIAGEPVEYFVCRSDHVGWADLDAVETAKDARIAAELRPGGLKRRER